MAADALGFPKPGDPVPGAPPALTSTTEPAAAPEPATRPEPATGTSTYQTRPAPRSRTRGAVVAAVAAVTALVGWALLRRTGNHSEES